MSEENKTSPDENLEQKETLEEIIVKQKGTGISAANRWKNLRQTIGEKRADLVSCVWHRD